MNCWICGGPASTGEHRIKASDIRAAFGKITQKRPVFAQASDVINQPVKGIRSKLLHGGARICAPCNNQRSQPYDRAWEEFSLFMRRRQPPIRLGQILSLKSVFPGHAQQAATRLHLYFVKQFGCAVSEAGIGIPLPAMSAALLEGKPHPNIFLRFSLPLPSDHRFLATTDIDLAELDGVVQSAGWAYVLEHIVVTVVYALPGVKIAGLRRAWHPTVTGKTITFSHCDP